MLPNVCSVLPSFLLSALLPTGEEMVMTSTLIMKMSTGTAPAGNVLPYPTSMLFQLSETGTMESHHGSVDGTDAPSAG